MTIIWCILSTENGKSISAFLFAFLQKPGTCGWFIIKRLHSFADAEGGENQVQNVV
jgi:hypothetical protein